MRIYKGAAVAALLGVFLSGCANDQYQRRIDEISFDIDRLYQRNRKIEQQLQAAEAANYHHRKEIEALKVQNAYLSNRVIQQANTSHEESDFQVPESGI